MKLKDAPLKVLEPAINRIQQSYAPNAFPAMMAKLLKYDLKKHRLGNGEWSYELHTTGHAIGLGVLNPKPGPNETVTRQKKR